MRLQQHSHKQAPDKSIRIKSRNYDPEFKKKVALFAENKGNQEAKRRFGVSESNIRRWKKIQKEQVLEKVAIRNASIKKKNKRRNEIVEDIPNRIDSMPLELRLKSPILPSTSEQEQILHSHPLSPTKLKVTRQTKPKELSSKPISPTPVEEICLKWNSHHGNMQSMFPALLLKEQYVDATLVAEGQTLKCHRMILSSCSPYFEEVLSNISQYQHPVLFMKDVPFWILKSLCDFMYSGEVLISQDKLNELLSAAENLKIKGLTGKPDVLSEDVLKESLYKHIKEEQKDDPVIEKEFEKKDILRDKKRYHTSGIISNITPEPTPPKNSKTQKTNDTSSKTSKIPKLNAFTDGSVVKNPPKISKIHTSHIESSPMKAVSSKVLRSSSSIRKVERADKLLIKEAISKGDILDPFDLLEPVYEEVQKETVIPNKVKDANKSVSIKKNVQKKVKKRKISDDRDESPPPVLSRKGTRSRPNKKIPRFYHSGFDNSAPKIQESQDTTIVREPHTNQAESQELSQSSQAELHDTEQAESHIEQTDPLFQLTDIKAEPFDVEDSTIEIEDNVVAFGEPDTSINEELLEENYESVIDFVEKNVAEKEEALATPFKKIRVTRKQVLLDVEKSNMVKIVDVDKIKVSGEIIEEDPLTLTSNLDNNIKIMTVESINEHVTSSNENKSLASDNLDATFKICTLTENLESSEKSKDNPLGFEIDNVVNETEQDKDGGQEKLIPVCQISEVFSENEMNKDKINKTDSCKSLLKVTLQGGNTENSRNEDTLELFEGCEYPICAVVERTETLKSSDNNFNIDDCKFSDVKETETLSETHKGHKESEKSDLQQAFSNYQTKGAYCSNESHDSLKEKAEDRKTTIGKLNKTHDICNRRVEKFVENAEGLHAVGSFSEIDSNVVEIDHFSQVANTVPIDYPNGCARNSQSSLNRVTFLQETGVNKDMSSDKQIEVYESLNTNSIECNSSLGETFEQCIISSELSTNEDIDMSSEEICTKDPVLANAIPYLNEDLPVATRQNEVPPMEVCEDSLSQGPATFDQTSNTYELVADVVQPTLNTPGFHIAQVVSEQIALNEECRLTNKSVNSSDTCFEDSMSGSNELEMIVNDLTKIVGESQRLESDMEHENIADSLDNLLEK